jgi:hypothetical protein
VFALAQIVSNTHRRAFAAEWARNYRSLLEHEHARAGDWLRAHLAPGSPVATFVDSGMVGYRSGLPIVDFGRLSDSYLASPGRSQEEAVEYFFARRAAALVATSFSRDRLAYEPEVMARRATLPSPTAKWCSCETICFRIASDDGATRRRDRGGADRGSPRSRGGYRAVRV